MPFARHAALAIHRHSDSARSILDPSHPLPRAIGATPLMSAPPRDHRSNNWQNRNEATARFQKPLQRLGIAIFPGAGTSFFDGTNPKSSRPHAGAPNTPTPPHVIRATPATFVPTSNQRPLAPAGNGFAPSFPWRHKL